MILSIADRISVTQKGKIVQTASPINVYRDPALITNVIEAPRAHLFGTCAVDGHRFRAVWDRALGVAPGDTLAPAPQEGRWLDPAPSLAVY